MKAARWVVVLARKAERPVGKLPKQIVEILNQLRQDLEAEGPTPRGWIVKHVLERPGVLAARLKREYRALYSVQPPTIVILEVVHRKDAY